MHWTLSFGESQNIGPRFVLHPAEGRLWLLTVQACVCVAVGLERSAADPTAAPLRLPRRRGTGASPHGNVPGRGHQPGRAEITVPELEGQARSQS